MADNKEVFISYNQHNKNEAEYLYNLLGSNGIGCWMAPRDIPAGSNCSCSINTSRSSRSKSFSLVAMPEF